MIAEVKSGELVRFKRTFGKLRPNTFGIALADRDPVRGECLVLTRHGEVKCPRSAIARLQFDSFLPGPNRLLLPYGTRTRRDGTIVFFNREYHHLWKVAPDGAWRTAVPWDRDGSGEQAFFPEWKPHNSPWRYPKAVASLNGRLAAHGIVGKPYLWEAIKRAVFDAEPNSPLPMLYDLDKAIHDTIPESATLRAALEAAPQRQ